MHMYASRKQTDSKQKQLKSKQKHAKASTCKQILKHAKAGKSIRTASKTKNKHTKTINIVENRQQIDDFSFFLSTKRNQK